MGAAAADEKIHTTVSAYSEIRAERRDRQRGPRTQRDEYRPEQEPVQPGLCAGGDGHGDGELSSD